MQSSQGTLDFKSVDKITFVGASSNTVIDTTTGSVGVGVDANGPTSNLHVVGDALITGNVAVTGTGSLTVPSGTTAQRPATATNGMLRYNTTESTLETYTTDWLPLTIGFYGLYEWSTLAHTFTRAAGDVRFGPTFAQMKTAYNTTVWYNNTDWFDEVSGKQGFQLWTVPETGTYRITAKGAQGGRTAGNGTYSNSPGNGAHISADIALMRGTKIVIIVGQAGEYPTGSNKYNEGAGGGGATWILKENFTTANDQVYMVAGGGGGASRPYSDNGTSGSANGGSQGILGGGGNSYSAGGGTTSNRASGGAGWTGDGSVDSNSDSSGGLRPANGAAGGAGGGGGAYSSLGGFGGGGGNGTNTAGGGAGASGGNAATHHDNSLPGLTALSTGGTSYIITTATNPTFSGNHSDYEGSVYIQAPGQF